MKEKKGVTTIYMKSGRELYQYLSFEEAMDNVSGKIPIIIKGRNIVDSGGNIVDIEDIDHEKVRLIEMRYDDGPMHLKTTCYVND